MGTGYGFDRVRRVHHAAAVGFGIGFGSLDDVFGWLVAFGACVADIDTKHGARQHQVVKDVVSITHPRHGEVFGVVVMLHDGHQVSRCLAGMMFGGEGVDDGHFSVLCQGSNVFVTKAAVGDATKEAGEHLSGITDGFRGAELDVVFQQREGATAEALNANLKGNPGPR